MLTNPDGKFKLKIKANVYKITRVRHNNSERRLTKVESGVVKKPSVQTMAKIAKALGVSIEELLK